ncbi:peptidase S8/S53 domain-containing protein [Fennellomyces sp. T-0311]|nr:peptidase S8/S53 domain-containing protein [Fennellomyces sp. T-0311]
MFLLVGAQRFTVQFHARPGNVSSIRQEQDSFLDQLQQANISFAVRYRYTHVMNALSIQITDHAMAVPYHSFLTRQPLVRRYWPGKRYPRPQSLLQDTGVPNLGSAHAMTGVHNISWTGKGIKVAILDTGVDYTHPALGGCFGVRVAPDVELGVWRIFGCEGNTDDDIILEAADRAIRDGMNIINLSIGSDEAAWEEDALAVALSSMGDHGIIVVVAQGNEQDGIARTPSPTTGRHTLAAASVDNGIKLADVIKVDNASFEYVLSDDSLHSFTDTTIRLALKDLACEPFQERLDNMTVLVKRGSCSFVDKAINVQNAGGTGILIYQDDDSNELDIGLLHRRKVHIPIGSIFNGQQLVSHFENMAFVDAERTQETMPIISAGLASTFSTWGPDAELHLKPDLAAVGGQVYSTYPVNLGRYSTMSGTSMATVRPLFTLFGARVLGNATGSRTPSHIFRALMNHARPIQTRDGRIESPIKQGAGLVQIRDAIDGETNVSPYKLMLNDTYHFEPEKILRIRNRSHVEKKYQLKHLPAAAIAGYNLNSSAVPLSRPVYIESNATVQFQFSTLTVPPNATRPIRVHFDPPRTRRQHLIFGGYLQIQTDDEKIHIPYFGATGNQHDLPIFDSMKGYPRIHPLKRAYNFHENDILHLHIRLGSPTARLRSVLVNLEEKRLGTLVNGYEKYVSRNDNSAENQEYTLDWRGQIVYPPTIQRGRLVRRVPPGRYKIRVSALKIFGDPLLKRDWEIWYSPEFDILG